MALKASRANVKHGDVLFHPHPLLHPTHKQLPQVSVWLLVTTLLLLATVLPAALLCLGVGDWVEVAEALLISLGLRAIATLSRVMLTRIFAIINDARPTDPVRGLNFFTVDSPLDQLVFERAQLNKARTAGVRARAGQMAAYLPAWIVLIVCCLLVRLGPDLLGAGLISQNVSKRIPQRLDFVAPDLGRGPRGDLRFRGNCVWNRGNLTKSDDRFGFLIFQYCMDIFVNRSEIDVDARTLLGKFGYNQIQVVFHIEAVTENIFTEKWEPFSNHTYAQTVLDDVLKKTSVDTPPRCPNEECRESYRNPDMVLTYLLLSRVGLIRRPLVGDAPALASLRADTVGDVAQRLTPTTRASFIVLIVLVNLFVLLQSLSTKEESTSVALARAVAALGGADANAGAGFDTAIAQVAPDVSRRVWSVRHGVECILVLRGDVDVEDVDEAEVGFKFQPVVDEMGRMEETEFGRFKLVRVVTDCAQLGFSGQATSVRGLVG